MLTKNKKLIFFSRDLKVGGMEKALVILLNRLQNCGYDITLVLTEKTGELLSTLSTDINVKEYRVSNCRIIPVRKAINLIRRTVWSVLNKNKYDFSCNYCTYLTVGSRLAAVASKNSSLYVHSDYYNYFKGNENEVIEFFGQQGIGLVKKLIFVSNEAMAPISAILPEYANKFTVISNLVEYTDIIRLGAEPVKEEKTAKELLVFVGRLEEESKRLTRLLRAFKTVCEKSDDFELWILGDGEGYKLCEELISEYKLGSKVKMLGQKLNPYPYISGADCVVLTSDFEGFPVIYNESIALKTPIITTVPVSDNFMDSRHFSVVVKKNPDDISEAILCKKYHDIQFENADFDRINEERIKKLCELL